MWTSRSLGEICDAVDGLIQTGPFGSQLHESDYVDQGVPVVMPKNILDGRVDTSDIALIGQKDADRLERHQMSVGDIVYGRRGDIGRRALIGRREHGWLCGTGCLRVSLGDRVLDPTYLYHFLGQPMVVNWITNQAVGATMPNLNTSILRSVVIRYPPLPVQRRIASILSAYDDLIENNTRRIKILEGVAQMLYREWFVNFRFPGHQKVMMKKSALGPIPKGWEVRSLRDVTSYIGRGISPTYDESAIGWVVNQKCIRDRRLNLGPARRQSKPVPPEKSVRKGDILINSTGVGTLGRVAQVHKELVNFTVDSHVSIVRPVRNADYLGEVALHLESSFEAMGVGSTGQTELGRERIAGTLFACPPDSLQTLYAEYARGIHQLSLCLFQKNEILRTTRDLLLPKLISGEISVEAADKALEQTA